MKQGVFVYGDGMTKRVGLIGYPLGHSISPVFQQAAFDNLDIDARYELWSAAPDKVLPGILPTRAVGKKAGHLSRGAPLFGCGA